MFSAVFKLKMRTQLAVTGVKMIMNSRCEELFNETKWLMKQNG